MLQNPFRVKKGNTELIEKVMKEVEKEYFKKHGSLEGLSERKLLEMANTYIAFELGMLHWGELVRAIYQRALNMKLFTKWENAFREFLQAISKGGVYSEDTTDFTQHLRLVYEKTVNIDLSENQKVQTVMAFALALRIMGYGRVFDVFMNESPIVKDGKYQEMFQEFRSIGGV